MPFRSPRASRPSRLATLAVLLLLAAGCGPSDGPDAGSGYEALTTGTAQELWDHAGRLESRYSQADPTDPASARKHLRAFTDALIATCDVILADPETPNDIRNNAARAEVACLQKRRQIDPDATARLLALTDSLEARHPESGVAAFAAYERVTTLQGLVLQADSANREARFRDLADAEIHLAGIKNSPPMTPDLIDHTARDADGYRFYDIARRLFETFRERYPDDERAGFAAGALKRLDSVGRTMDEIKGPGAGGAEVSAADFRGKVVLVVFWSTGWQPSVDEVAEIESLRKQKEADGLVVLGVCLDPDPATAESLIQAQALPWPQIFSQLNIEKRASSLGVALGIPTIPYKFVLDRDGRLLAMAPFLKDVRPKIDETLAAEPPPATPQPAPAPR